MKPEDLRYTPKSAFEPILNIVLSNETLLFNTTSFSDPCQGDGRLVRWMIDKGLEASGIDIREGTDYLSSSWSNTDTILLMTNPPYSKWKEFVTKATFDHNNTFMLLNLRYLGAQNRREWWKRHEPSALFVLSERPKFDRWCMKRMRLIKEDHTDNAEYAWYYWGPHYHGIFHL